MNLYERKNKSGLSFYIGYYDEFGKRHRYLLKGIKTRKHAELAFAEYQLRYERDQVGLPTNEKLTLVEALMARKEERISAGVSQAWVVRFRSLKNNLIKGLGESTLLRGLNDTRAADYRNARLKQGASVQSVNMELKLLVASARLAVEQGKIAKLPWRKVNYAIDRTGKEAWAFMSDDECARVLYLLRYGRQKQMMRKNGRHYTFELKPSIRMWTMITFLLNTGARKGEMFALRWSDVNLEQLTVRLFGAKSAKNGVSAKVRHIPMNIALVEMFQTLPKGSGRMPVFKHDPNLRIKFNKVLKWAGLSHYRIHDLRHTFASQLAMRGIPLYTIAQLLGHSSVETTKRYAHLAPESLACAVQTLNFSSCMSRENE